MSTQTVGAVPEFSLADRLRKAREFAGLGQAELADRMGVSRGTIGNAEGGKHAVRTITLKAWALATGVDAGWLETGVPWRPRPDSNGQPTDYKVPPSFHRRLGSVA